MKSILILTVIVLTMACCENVEYTDVTNTTPRKVEKADEIKATKPLSSEQEYKIIEDRSDSKLDKNEVVILLSKELSENQIEKIALELFNNRTKRKRFYIFYKLKGHENAPVAWAVSHFDPDLKIEILGTRAAEAIAIKQNAEVGVDGKILGKWYEADYVSASFVLFEKGKKKFMKMAFKDGSFSIDELSEEKIGNGRIRLVEKESDPHGEYYVFSGKDNGLEFYNSQNRRFTVAKAIQ